MFVKYSSLTNHYEGKFINGVIMNGLTGGVWVAREKIHGANFSLITSDGIKVIPAKRSGEILPAEQFYGCEPVVAKYSEPVRKLWEMLFAARQISGNYDEELVIQVYGEFAGRGVQKDVDYGEKDFYVFDIRVNGRFLPDNVVANYAVAVGLKMAPLLAYGTFDEIRALPITFDSVVNLANSGAIPAQSFVEPEFKNFMTLKDGEGENIAEGFVMKPVLPAFMPNGERVAIKCKTTKFTEKKNKQANRFNAPSELSETDKAKLNEFTCFLTENRVKNVLSKIDSANLTAKDFGRVMGLTVQDALEEIERNYGPFLEQFENPTLAKKTFTNEASNLVRENWGAILNNEF
ncbi:RNA ligase [Citrobacter phage Margaery]|uniref:RNA ligase 2 n=2 Tax=Pseudotevenvirus margaery TaxID=2843955 RepID=A0A0M4RT38_9CAUD|nr:RNA ligase [Citrobacter phage Margaery]ALF01930.1 RNA ligase [Citrobacter phage Margaery]AYJ73100.1 RNA ligase 2 [Citrobacter phage Maroon]URP85709.1 RNA ligase [Enterobacter phage EC-W2]